MHMRTEDMEQPWSRKGSSPESNLETTEKSYEKSSGHPKGAVGEWWRTACLWGSGGGGDSIPRTTLAIAGARKKPLGPGCSALASNREDAKQKNCKMISVVTSSWQPEISWEWQTKNRGWYAPKPDNQVSRGCIKEFLQVEKLVGTKI